MSLAPITLTESATALAFPPTAAIAWLSAEWLRGDVREFFLEWSAEADTDMTAARLYGLRLLSLVNADDTFTATHATETFTAASHGLRTGDGPFRVSNSGGALPTGLAADTDYWIIRVDANDFKLAETRALAFAGTPVAISANGTGTHTLSDTSTTTRVKFDSFGLLGDAGDGAFSVSDEGLAYTEPFRHKLGIIGYAVSATLSGANAQKIYIRPAH